MKVAVLFKEGYEEVEALSVVDVLRRGQVECTMVGMDEKVVKSSHDIKVEMDMVFDETVYDYDVVVLPGGLPGAPSLRDDQRVIDIVRDFYNKDKYVCAICAAPIVLERAGLLEGKNFTCYPGFEQEAKSGNYQDVLVVQDGKMITGRGPAASFAFGYKILEACGKDSEPLQKGMQYPYLTK